MSGRVRVHEDQARTAEEVIAELLDAALASEDRDRASLPPAEPAQPAQITSRDQTTPGPLTGPDARSQIDDAARQTLEPGSPAAEHASFTTVSRHVGQIDPDAFADTMRARPRRRAGAARGHGGRDRPGAQRRRRDGSPGGCCRRWGASARRARRGTRRLVARAGAPTATSTSSARSSAAMGCGRGRRASSSLASSQPRHGRSACWSTAAARCSGHAVAIAAVAAAAIVQAASDRLRCGVIAFASEPLVLLDPRDERARRTRSSTTCCRCAATARTDLARALPRRPRQLEHVPPGGRAALLLSDALHTKGADPLARAGALDCLHVLGTSAEPDSIDAGKALARRGHGRWLPATSLDELARSLQAVLP